MGLPAITHPPRMSLRPLHVMRPDCPHGSRPLMLLRKPALINTNQAGPHRAHETAAPSNHRPGQRSPYSPAAAPAARACLTPSSRRAVPCADGRSPSQRISDCDAARTRGVVVCEEIFEDILTASGCGDIKVGSGRNARTLVRVAQACHRRPAASWQPERHANRGKRGRAGLVAERGVADAVDTRPSVAPLTADWCQRRRVLGGTVTEADGFRRWVGVYATGRCGTYELPSAPSNRLPEAGSEKVE
jgi:hypothetical protein